MKKIIALILAAILLLTFVACGETADTDDDETSGKKKNKGTVYTCTDEDGINYKLTLKSGNKFLLEANSEQKLDEDDLSLYGLEGEKDITLTMVGEINGTYVENEDGTLTLKGESGKQKQTITGADAEELKTKVKEVYKSFLDGGMMDEEDYNEGMKIVNGEWADLDEDEFDSDMIVTLNKEDKTFVMVYDDDYDWEDDDGDDDDDYLDDDDFGW